MAVAADCVGRQDVSSAVRAAEKGTSEPVCLTSLVGESVLLVDGAHRVEALRNSNVRQVIRLVNATLWTGKDLTPFEIQNYFSVGGRLNEIDLAGVKTSQWDRVHLFSQI